MTEIRIASIPQMELMQEAYEALVVKLQLARSFENSDAGLTILCDKINKANEMINHIIGVTQNLTKDV